VKNQQINFEDLKAEIHVPEHDDLGLECDERVLTKVINEYLDHTNRRAEESVVSDIYSRCIDCWDYITYDGKPYFELTVEDLEWAVTQVLSSKSG
jgi:hypothetical protein